MRPCVFLDRDETLIANATLPPPERPHPAWKPGDLSDPERVVLLDGALEACRMMRGAGYALVVVSNQGCVARGSATIKDVEAVNARVSELLVDNAGVPLIGSTTARITRRGTCPSTRGKTSCASRRRG